MPGLAGVAGVEAREEGRLMESRSPVVSIYTEYIVSTRGGDSA